MATSKTDPSKQLTIDPPRDLGRRLKWLKELWPTTASTGPAPAPPPAPAETNPALLTLPPPLRGLAVLPAPRLLKSADTVIQAHELLDAPQFTDAQLAEMNVPQAATAVIVAREQALVLGGLPQDLSALFPVGAAALGEQLGKHSELSGINPGLQLYLNGVDLGLLSVQAAREAGRQQVEEAARALLRELPPTDPTYTLITARLAPIDALKGKQADKEAQAGRQQKQHRQKAQDLLAEVQGQQLLADVWHKLQHGQMPDYQTLLQAARFLRQQQEQGAMPASDSPTPTTTTNTRTRPR